MAHVKNGSTPNDPHHWTQDYAFAHLKETFDAAAKDHPDLMEPFVNRLADADQQTQTSVMREALRSTFGQRHPSKYSPPEG